MKTFICIAIAAASVVLAGCAGNSTDSNTQAAASGNQPPKGWVCPMHGQKCPWMMNRGHCAHYKQHGYGHCHGGGCCN